jgi:hypothetical protein
MNLTPTLLASMILVPAVGLTIWVWIVIDQVDEEFRRFSGFEKEHFEIGPPMTVSPGGMR